MKGEEEWGEHGPDSGVSGSLIVDMPGDVDGEE